LAISRNLAEAHGGTIQAENVSPNGGAKFTVTLPCFNSSPLKVRTSSSFALQKNFSFGENWKQEYSRLLNGLRVLVVDDEESACDAFRESLVAFGLEVRTATSAAKAFDSLNQFESDLLISDIAMPEEDGYHLIRRIRALPPPKGRIPAIAITAFASGDDVTQALKSGFQAHLAKPVDTAVMLETIAVASGRMGTLP
jgi:CheY-like chemotaxis protein